MGFTDAGSMDVDSTAVAIMAVGSTAAAGTTVGRDFTGTAVRITAGRSDTDLPEAAAAMLAEASAAAPEAVSTVVVDSTVVAGIDKQLSVAS